MAAPVGKAEEVTATSLLEPKFTNKPSETVPCNGANALPATSIKTALPFILVSVSPSVYSVPPPNEVI